MHDSLRDLRLGFRALRRRPLLLITATLTLGLGVGASTGVFSVIEAALLQPLPFRDADRLAVVWGVAGPEEDIRGASPIEIRNWDEAVDALGPLALYNETTLNLGGEGRAELLEAELVGSTFFQVLGVAPILGRGFLPGDDEAGAAGRAVISHDLWQRRFAGSPDITGRSLLLDDVSFTVAGVMPRGFHGLSFDTEIWVTLGPFASPAGLADRGGRYLAALGRLAPGASQEAAQAQLDAVATRLEEAYPDTNRDRGAMLLPLRDFYVGQSRSLLLLVLGGVLVLLMITAANVASLQLVRAVERRREVALRHALGAGAMPVARQFLVESALLAAIGGLAGLVLAWVGIQTLLPLVPDGVLPPNARPAIDPAVLGFGILATLTTALLFSAVPALQAARQDPAGALRLGGRGSTRGSGARAQRAIIVGEVALAFVLVVGAGLAARSLRAQLALEPGFEPAGVLAGRVSLSSDGYDSVATRISFARDMVDELSGSPGVERAGLASRAPLRGYDAASYIYRAEDPIDADHRIRFYLHSMSPGTLELLGIPIVEGRGLTASDVRDGPGVAVVSRAFAEKVWPGSDPLGRRVVFGGDTATVVGIAGNVRQRTLTTDLMDPGEDPDVYFAYDQVPTRNLDLLVRSAGDPAVLTGAIREALARRDPSIPLYDVATLESELAAQTALGRMVSWFLGVFASLALVAAAVGLFGVLAFAVRGRRAEIAVRAALGAAPARIQRMVVGQGLTLVALGLLLGLAGALGAVGIAASQLYGVHPMDPIVLGGTALVLLLLGAAASAIPAFQAMRVDPRSAMAEE